MRPALKYHIYFALFVLHSAALQAQIVMVFVKGDTFLMGHAAADPDERPRHAVVLSDFQISATEVTYANFAAFVDSTGYLTDAERRGYSYAWDSLGWHQQAGTNWRHDERGRLCSLSRVNYRQFPVVHVSWNDAAMYCNWLSLQENLPQVYTFQGDSVRVRTHAGGYRLPSEAEWEFAASGGGKDRYPFSGGAGIAALGWYSGNAGHSAHPVAQKKANRLGLFDMTGNVWEWCLDRYDARYYEKSRNASDPCGPERGVERSVRGGAWNNTARHCRINNRTSRFPDFSDGSIGFRVVKG